MKVPYKMEKDKVKIYLKFKLKAMELFILLMVTFIKDCFKMIFVKDTENFINWMEMFTKDNYKSLKCKDKGFYNLNLVMFIMVFGKITWDMATVATNGKMVRNIQDNGLIIRDVEQV